MEAQVTPYAAVGWSASVQVMDYSLFGTKSLPEPMLIVSSSGLSKANFVKALYSKFKHFHL